MSEDKMRKTTIFFAWLCSVIIFCLSFMLYEYNFDELFIMIFQACIALAVMVTSFVGAKELPAPVKNFFIAIIRILCKDKEKKSNVEEKKDDDEHNLSNY